MPRLLTKRQTKFLAAFAATGNATQSALAAGYSQRSARTTAYRLMHRSPVIAAGLKDAQAQAVQATAYTLEAAMREAQAAMEFAEKTKQANAYVKAVALRAQLAGHLREKIDLTVERVSVTGALIEARERLLRPSSDPIDGAEYDVIAPADSSGGMQSLTRHADGLPRGDAPDIFA